MERDYGLRDLKKGVNKKLPSPRKCIENGAGRCKLTPSANACRSSPPWSVGLHLTMRVLKRWSAVSNVEQLKFSMATQSVPLLISGGPAWYCFRGKRPEGCSWPASNRKQTTLLFHPIRASPWLLKFLDSSAYRMIRCSYTLPRQPKRSGGKSAAPEFLSLTGQREPRIHPNLPNLSPDSCI